jgi:hypothetical protein
MSKLDFPLEFLHNEATSGGRAQPRALGWPVQDCRRRHTRDLRALRFLFLAQIDQAAAQLVVGMLSLVWAAASRRCPSCGRDAHRL